MGAEDGLVGPWLGLPRGLPAGRPAGVESPCLGAALRAPVDRDDAAPPRPMLCWSATFAPSTWRLSAVPRSCQVSSEHCARPVAPSGWPLEIRPPDGFTTGPAAVGRRLRVDELVALALGGKAERLVGDQLVGGEAVVQLDHLDVLRHRPAPPRRRSAAAFGSCRSRQILMQSVLLVERAMRGR